MATLLAALAIAVLAGCGGADGGGEELACDGDADAFSRQMDEYGSGRFATATPQQQGRLDALMVRIPKLDVAAAGTAEQLPLGPCQYIYRFQYLDLERDAAPFEYVEIDWNTEGEPRGPNGSFVTPHFDFHFYLLPRQQVDSELQCKSSNGRTCDPTLTAYDRTRRFLEMPAPEELPSSYKPDIDSSIPEMGLHHLDFAPEYTVDYVNHHPTLIYGSFDQEVVFLESSVTPVTLRDAVDSSSHRVSVPLAQPEVCPAPRWPTSFVVRYLPDSGGFEVGFAGFEDC